MTPERLEEIRRHVIEREWSHANDEVEELLAEVDRLRALEPRLHSVEAHLDSLIKRLERMKEMCRDA